MGDDLVERQQVGFEHAHDFGKSRPLDVAADDTDFVARDLVLFYLAAGVLVHPEQYYAPSTADGGDALRQRRTGSVHYDIGADPGGVLDGSHSVFGAWIDGGAHARFARHLPAEFDGLDDERLSRARRFVQHQEKQTNGAAAVDSDTLARRQRRFLQRIKHTGERFGER